MYITGIHDLHIALSTHRPQWNRLLSPYIGPSLPSTTPMPLSPGNHHSVVCPCQFQCYIPHMNATTWFLAFSDWHIVLSIIFSKSTHVVANSSISSFLMQLPDFMLAERMMPGMIECLLYDHWVQVQQDRFTEGQSCLIHLIARLEIKERQWHNHPTFFIPPVHYITDIKQS